MKSIDLELGLRAAGDKALQSGGLSRRDRLGQEPQHETREIAAAFAIVEPIAEERGEVRLVELGFDRRGVEKLLLDELSQVVGDALLITGNDRRVRDRKPQRPPEQGDDRVPVGQAPDKRRLRKGGDEAERGVAPLQGAGDDEQEQAAAKDPRGQELYAV